MLVLLTKQNSTGSIIKRRYCCAAPRFCFVASCGCPLSSCLRFVSHRVQNYYYFLKINFLIFYSNESIIIGFKTIQMLRTKLSTHVVVDVKLLLTQPHRYYYCTRSAKIIDRRIIEQTGFNSLWCWRRRNGGSRSVTRFNRFTNWSN